MHEWEGAAGAVHAVHGERPGDLSEGGVLEVEGFPDGAVLEEVSDAVGFDFEGGSGFVSPIGYRACDEWVFDAVLPGVGEECASCGWRVEVGLDGG